MKIPHFNICITCVGGRLIYDMINAMRDSDDYTLTVIGIDANPDAHGRLLCDYFRVLPMAAIDPEGWVSKVCALKDELGIDAIICLSDDEARIASQHREMLNAIGIRTSVSKQESVDILTDKLLLLRHLELGGLKVGSYFEVNSIEDLQQSLNLLNYPTNKIVLKPRRGSGSRGVLVFDSKQTSFELNLQDRFCGAGTYEHIYVELTRRNIDLKNWLAVPYWDGSVFDVECIVKHGQVIMISSRRRQLKNVFSPTSTGHLVDLHPSVLKYAKHVCEILDLEGAVDLDIVLLENDIAIPLDASARFSGSIGGSYTAGANFFAQLIRVMFDLPLRHYEIIDQTPLRPFITMAAIPKKNSDQLL
jgi:predicted ATP-grasp superfamily ATP-dependent carboligase